MTAAPAPAAPAHPLWDSGKLLLGVGEQPVHLTLSRANRHGLIAGATGTGKTVTLQCLAESFAAQGVPVFMADVKGDLAGLAASADASGKAAARAADMQLAGWNPRAMPVVFWDMFGKSGHPLRMTISELGAPILSRLLDLSDAQEGVLAIAFAYADEEGMLLLDLADLKALLIHVGEQAKSLSSRYGNVSQASVNAITRKLLQLEQEGAEALFGEPAITIADIMKTTYDGCGVISVLAAETLIQRPRSYAMFLLWLLSELFEQLPEVGDLEKPKLVFFFDEAHLLFTDAPKPMLQKIEQVVRLIRSKGVGVYFITQQPQDVPDTVLAQLGNRVQHALRAFTPADQKAVRAAAQTFRPNPRFSTEEAITQLAVGEALVSTLAPDGTPTMVERVRIRPPFTRMGTISPEERAGVMARDGIGAAYDTPVNRHSAYEMLASRRNEQAANAPAPAPARKGKQPASIGEQIAKEAVRAATSSLGRKLGNRLVRGILGSILK